MSLIKYDSYKDSGVDWLGEIPQHWEIRRIKDLVFNIGSGVTPKGGSEVYQKKGIPFIRSQNVYNDGLRIDNVSYISKEIHSKMKSSEIKPYDILINITGASIGRTCLVPVYVPSANINQHVIFIRIKGEKKFFVSQYMKSSFIKEFIMSVQMGTSKEALTMGQTLRIPIFLPPLQEQQKIAKYLDQQTKTIDKKINLLKAKAAHYQALKKSLINETVCRGLDKTVGLKDSGIEWIGAIPEHWEIKRLKNSGFLYSGLSGKKGVDFNQENNPNNRGFIPFTNIANNTYLDKNHLGIVEVKENENQNQVQKHDLFFLMSSEGYEDLGKSALLVDNVGEVYLNSFCKGFRLTDNNIHSYYLNYLLLSDSYRNTMIIEGKGFTRINLKMNKINDFIIAVPSLKEQQQIAKYLDKKTAIIDQIIANIQSQVERLKELRKSLINEVVTGKVRVAAMETVQ